MIDDATWGGLVRRIAAECGLDEPSEEAIDHILWERTAFPLAGAVQVERQVREHMQRIRDREKEAG